VDEAHSSQAGDAVKKLKRALAEFASTRWHSDGQIVPEK